MLGFIWALLLACAPCTGNGNGVRPETGWSFIQVHAQMQSVRKVGTVTTKLAAGTDGTLLKPLSVASRAEARRRRRARLASSYSGCMDPAATNYDPTAYVDSGGCYFTDEAPDFNYSFSANQRMSPGDALMMYQMGHIVGKLLDRYDIRWWVTDGSLLGALRNNGIIPHDDDIDLNVLLPQVSQLKTDEFRNELHRNDLHLDDDIVYTDRMYVWNYTEYNRTRGQSNERGTRMKLDLWPMEYVRGRWQQMISTEHAFPGRLCNVLPFADAGHWNYSCRLERRRFGLGEVWAPTQPTSEGYLVQRYGAWDAAPECVGTLHDCHLIENTTHDMLGYAEPSGPLLEPADPLAEPVSTAAHG